MENLLTAEVETPTTDTPPQVPEKFLDKKTNAIRTDALLKSYLELEKKHSQVQDLSQADPAKLRKALGVPDSHDDYCVDCSHGLFEADSTINQRLHAKGFSPEQVQEVYDLAAEKLVPMIVDLAREYEAERQVERLVAHFGGAEKWQATAKQLLAFGQKQLPAPVLQGLASSFEGVVALEQMMQAKQPLSLRQGEATVDLSDKALQAMMRDPKYWRDRDPSLIAKVADGFKSLYEK